MQTVGGEMKKLLLSLVVVLMLVPTWALDQPTEVWGGDQFLISSRRNGGEDCDGKDHKTEQDYFGASSERID
jgi:hypothetical protein